MAKYAKLVFVLYVEEYVGDDVSNKEEVPRLPYFNISIFKLEPFAVY